MSEPEIRENLASNLIVPQGFDPKYPGGRKSFRWLVRAVGCQGIVGTLPCFIFRSIEFDGDHLYLEYNQTIDDSNEHAAREFFRHNRRVEILILDSAGSIVESWHVQFTTAVEIPARHLDYSSADDTYPCFVLKLECCNRVV